MKDEIPLHVLRHMIKASRNGARSAGTLNVDDEAKRVVDQSFSDLRA